MERTSNYEGNYGKILEQLISGIRITTMSVLKSIKTSELRTYLSQIRKTIQVSDEWVKRPDGKRYKEYFIPIKKVTETN